MLLKQELRTNSTLITTKIKLRDSDHALCVTPPAIKTQYLGSSLNLELKSEIHSASFIYLKHMVPA